MTQEYPEDKEFELQDFDQNEFYFSAANAHGMDNSGFIFVPENCQNGTLTCHLHVHFHGCSQVLNIKFVFSSYKILQGQEFVGAGYARRTEFLPLAEANNIVMVFPQIQSSFFQNNMFGCWDIFGYNGDVFNSQYATKNGKQMAGIAKLIETVSGVNMYSRM